MTRLLLCALLVVGCSASTGREVASSEPAPLDAAPSEPVCEPVTCDLMVSGALEYFTAPDCSEASRLVPVKPGDQAAYMVWCDTEGGVWAMTERAAQPGAVWGGDGCRELPGMLDGFEWWVAEMVDICE